LAVSAAIFAANGIIKFAEVGSSLAGVTLYFFAVKKIRPCDAAFCQNLYTTYYHLL